MKPSFRIFLAGLTLGLLAALGGWFWWRDTGQLPLPDERKVAMEVLTGSQTGPRYFHPVPNASTPDEKGILWISPAAARDQVDEVLSVRELNATARDKILKLIDETSEPHPSRIIGGERINLARLNLALDGMK
ncbi:potassium-transporting ATPase subunit C [Haloferula sp. BvORR071]|uniref:potassium-transporting ATPase subunit C n=1 Tax=Haloferula sp. BvORR071 TaxID=1396141 RepID=UPI000551EC7B|nr:potassium-transporting ATPase subunit C [Haloferula sp. BvORR071]